MSISPFTFGHGHTDAVETVDTLQYIAFLRDSGRPIRSQLYV